MCSSSFSAVKIYPKVVIGQLQRECLDRDWKETISNTAGPVADVGLCIAKVALAVALKNRIPRPFVYCLATGGVIWTTVELFSAVTSILNKDNGDFGRIAKKGYSHLVPAVAVLLSAVALEVLLLKKL